MAIPWRNVGAVVAGVVIGSIVNSLLVTGGAALVPAPEGMDTTSTAGLRASMHLLQPRHFVMPFLGHALGTLVGAGVAFRVATTHRAALAYGVGALFFCGGIVAASMIPAPAWFIALDLLAAYFPMAWLATRVSGGRKLAAA